MSCTGIVTNCTDGPGDRGRYCLGLASTLMLVRIVPETPDQ
jgi:hypothetical protein